MCSLFSRARVNGYRSGLLGRGLSKGCGVALWGSWRRGVGDAEGVALVRSLLQVYGLAGYHPGLNQCLAFLGNQPEVGAWSPRSFVGRMRTPDWVSWGEDPSQKEVRQWTAHRLRTAATHHHHHHTSHAPPPPHTADQRPPHAHTTHHTPHTTQRNATQRNATQRNATQRNATQRNATQRNATQRNATQRNATQRNATQRNATHTNHAPQRCAAERNAIQFSTTQHRPSAEDVARVQLLEGFRAAQPCAIMCVGSSSEVSGVRVFKVHPGSPAAEAGLEIFFDFIVQVNGTTMDAEGQRVLRKTSRTLRTASPRCRCTTREPTLSERCP